MNHKIGMGFWYSQTTEPVWYSPHIAFCSEHLAMSILTARHLQPRYMCHSWRSSFKRPLVCAQPVGSRCLVWVWGGLYWMWGWVWAGLCIGSHRFGKTEIHSTTEADVPPEEAVRFRPCCQVEWLKMVEDRISRGTSFAGPFDQIPRINFGVWLVQWFLDVSWCFWFGSLPMLCSCAGHTMSSTSAVLARQLLRRMPMSCPTISRIVLTCLNYTGDENLWKPIRRDPKKDRLLWN